MINEIITVIYFVALFGMIGNFICRFFILPKAAFSIPSILLALRYSFFICLFFISITSLMIFFLRSMEMNHAVFDNIYLLLSAVLSQTHFGYMMLLRFIDLFLLWVISIRLINSCDRFNFTFCIAFLLVLFIPFTTSTISHAGDQGNFSLNVFMDYLHIVSGASWAGSIITVALCIFPFYFSIDLIHRLSLIAMISVLIVLTSGYTMPDGT